MFLKTTATTEMLKKELWQTGQAGDRTGDAEEL